MNKFLPQKQASIDDIAVPVFGTVVFLMPIIIDCYRKQVSVISLLFAGLSILTIVFAIRMNKMGVYCLNGEIFHQATFRRERIEPTGIAAIKVTYELTVRPASPLLYGPLVPRKNKEGGYVLSMFLIHTVTDGMEEHRGGDLRFLQEFRRQIICQCVYDQETVDYLLTRNPNIVVWQ